MSNPRPTIFPGFNQILHGGDYNPDQWQHAPEVIEEDFRLIKLAGCNTFSLGIFSWTSYEPEEGRFTFDWLDRIMDRMAQDGHRAILATPSGAKPAWMSFTYPEIRRVDGQGLRDLHRRRHNHCWSSPVYREKVRIINTKLAERYGKHPALAMWHISNEMNGECYCDLCLKWWQEWLREKYGTLEALNQAWWSHFWSHTFTDWSQVEPRDFSLDGMRVDWLRFTNHQLRDFYLWECRPLRAHSVAPITTNFMGLHPPVDYAKLAEIVDVIADDQYPAYYPDDPNLVRSAVNVSFKGNLYRCFKPDRPWMLMESCTGAPQWKQPTHLKRPGVHQTEMLQALGGGAEGTCYFQWRKGRGSCEKFHGAVVDHAGHEHTREFRDVADLGALYRKLPEVLGSVVQSEVAMLYDWESRWGIEHSDGPGFRDEMYADAMCDHYHPFWEQGISVDVLSSERDFSGYRVVIAPLLWMLKPGVAARARAFVEAGGVFITTFFSGICDEHNLCFTGGWPGDGLMALCGVWNEETDVLREDETRRVRTTGGAWAGKKRVYQAGHVCGVAHLRGAKALAVYDQDFYKGQPVLTRNTVGKGQAYYLAARVEVDFLRAFYGKLVRDMTLQRPLAAALPRGVTVQERVKAQTRYLFIQNFNNTAKRIALDATCKYRRLRDGKAVRGTLALAPMGSDILAR